MFKTIDDGNFYITNRKKQEKNLKKDLDGIEGFDVISRLSQKKNPSQFYIPEDVDPGQMVMCKEMSKIRYVKLNKSGDFLNIQQVEVYDEHGTNVALVKEPGAGKPIATMSSSYTGTNPYMALDWPNIAHTGEKSSGWWQVDLGKLVNVKKIVIYNRQDGDQSSLDRLDGTVVSLMDNAYNIIWTTTLNSNSRQEFIINKKICGGPVIEKNLEDFEELQELQTQYNRELQSYNQAIQERLDNSRKYVSASNKSNNEYANTYVRDKATGGVGYVTERGIYKPIRSATIADDIDGKKGCPVGWKTNYNSYTQPEGETKIYDSSIPIGQNIKINEVDLIKGTNMIDFQSCQQAENNVFITEPKTPTNLSYFGCMSGSNPGEYQSDLEDATFESCSQRAADIGSNVFMFGPKSGSSEKSSCYVGETSDVVKDGAEYCYKTSQGHHLGGINATGQTTYAKYTTKNAGRANLNQLFNITDDLQARLIPESLVHRGKVNMVGDFQLMDGYMSGGNDIGTTAESSNLDEVKNICRKTENCSGFVYRPSTGQYNLKNQYMWPAGKRQKSNSSDPSQLYVRMPATSLHNSCSSKVNPISQSDFSYQMGSTMQEYSTCALGTVTSKDLDNINIQYNKLNIILEKIHSRIIQLGRNDIELNNRLIGQYNLLKNRLNKYEQVYKNIKTTSEFTKHGAALEEDSNLNMLSNDKIFLLWSIAAMGITAGALKFMK